MTRPEVDSSVSPHEDKFWNIPVATARTLRFTDDLMDEKMEVGDVSEISLKSPKLLSASTSRSSSPRLDIEEYSGNDLDHASDSSLRETCIQLVNSTISHHEKEDEESQRHRDRGDNPAVRQASQPSSDAVLDTQIVLPVLDPSLHGTLGSKIRVNSVVERIVVSLTDWQAAYLFTTNVMQKARIWATVGEVIMPGHPFDTSSVSRKPPRGKETM